MVNPDTRVRHAETEEQGVRDDDRARLLARHRLRTVLTCYGVLNLIRVLPQIAILTMATTISSLLTGHPGRAKSALGAWSWNFAHYSSIRRRSRYLDRIRLVPDNEVRNLQTRGSAQVRAAMRRPASEERFAAAAAVGRSVADTLAPGPRRTALMAWVVAVAFLLIGSRQLLAHGVPAIGQLAPLPSSATDLLRTFGSGWRMVGMGTTAAAPTAFALISLGAIPALGHMALLHTLLALLPLLIGLIGMWRLTEPLASVRPRIASLVAYAAIPLPYNALSNGRLDGLVAYAVMPWVVGRLARASGLAPFARSARAGWKGEVLGLGLVLAIAMAFTPFVAVLVVGVALCIVRRERPRRRRPQGRSGRSASRSVVWLVAFVLNVPWALGVVRPGADWSGFAGIAPAGPGTLSLGQILRFETGSIGAAPLGWAFLVVGALALVIGRGWRLGWAARAWTIAAVPFALTWVAARGWIDVGLPSADALLAPAAVGLALAAGLGIAAFEIDLRGYRFGWRQLASLIAAAALAVGVVPSAGRRVRGSVAGAAQRLRGIAEVHGERPAGRRVPRPVARATQRRATLGVAARGRRRLRHLRQRPAGHHRPLGWHCSDVDAAHRRERHARGGWPHRSARLAARPDGHPLHRRARTPRSEPEQHAPRAPPRRRSRPRSTRSSTFASSTSTTHSTCTRTRCGHRSVRASRVTGPHSRPCSIRAGCTRSKATSASARSGSPRRRTTRGTSRSGARACPAPARTTSRASYEVDTAGTASLSFDTSWTRTAAIAGQGVLWILTILLLLRWRTSTPWRRPRRRPAVTVMPVDGNGDGSAHVSAELETSGAASA